MSAVKCPRALTFGWLTETMSHVLLTRVDNGWIQDEVTDQRAYNTFEKEKRKKNNKVDN